MFANRFTAFIDACTLASVLRRNLLLSLAAAEFFRVRWSSEVLDETEKAIEKMLRSKEALDPGEKARKARLNMEEAFEEATVTDYDSFLRCADALPDAGDAHVLAAALKTKAAVIVTENLKHFPTDILKAFGVEVRSADAFIADTIALDPGRAVAAIKEMRLRFKIPEKTAENLLLDMEAAGLTETVDVLKQHVLSL